MKDMIRGVTHNVGHFLVTNTVWLFVTTIFFVSFNRIMTLHDSVADEGFVYLSLEKWDLYFRFASSLLFLFLPILLFTYCRNWLKENVGKWLFRGFWIYCFCFHGLLLLYFAVDQYFPALRNHADTPLVFGIAILLAELIVQFNSVLQQKLQLNRWLGTVKMESALLGLIFLVALIFSFPPFNRSLGDVEGFTFFVEIIADFLKWLLLFLLIYGFYWMNHYLLVEKVFKQNGIFYYGFAFIGLSMFFLPIFAVVIKYCLVSEQIWRFGADAWIPKGERTTPFYAFPSMMVWKWMYFTVPIILIHQWWKQQNDITQLEKEKSKAELNALKQQINPHFLFNTLNALYALGIEENSAKTADGIAKLGTLMRYNLNDAQKQFITLRKEIAYIEQYVELQKLRLTDNNQLSVQLSTDRVAGFQIAPLLLIPFIENAFKFGVSARAATKIDLKISIVGNRLMMQLFNTITINKASVNGNGIGISNTRKRLAKLYPNRYELNVAETATEFEVYLELQLDE